MRLICFSFMYRIRSSPCRALLWFHSPPHTYGSHSETCILSYQWFAQCLCVFEIFLKLYEQNKQIFLKIQFTLISNNTYIKHVKKNQNGYNKWIPHPQLPPKNKKIPIFFIEICPWHFISSCIDVHFRSNKIVSVRDGAYSLFDNSKAVDGFSPTSMFKVCRLSVDILRFTKLLIICKFTKLWLDLCNLNKLS